jgi:hypothetical protein
MLRVSAYGVLTEQGGKAKAKEGGNENAGSKPAREFEGW